MTRLLRHVFLSLVLLFLISPIVVVGGVSLNEKKSLYFPPQGLSLAWYVELFTQEDWLVPIENSMVIATLSSLAALSIALPLAYFLWRYRVFYARALFMLGIAPFMLPPVITALGFLSFWATVGLYGEMAATIVSHAIFFVTLPLVTISLGFESIDREIVEAAETMGADSRAVFRTVVLPMVRSYMVSGYAFCFVPQPERVHHRLHGLGVHGGDPADQDLQRPALRLHAGHGLGHDVLRPAGRAHLRAHRPLRGPAETNGRAHPRESEHVIARGGMVACRHPLELLRWVGGSAAHQPLSVSIFLILS